MVSTNSPHRRTFLLSLIAGLLLHAVIAHAATLTVTSTSDSGPGTLRQALTDAAPGDTINFSLPQGSVIGLMSGSLVIDRNLTINGPGAQLLNVRNINPNIAADRFRIFTISAGGFNVAISGLTISNGNPAGSAGGGGGIFNQTGTLTITGCAISGNRVHNGQGGGIVNVGGKLHIINSSITDNHCYGSLLIGGGGIYNLSVPGYDSSVDISNTTISNNDASGGDGGGIWNDSENTAADPPRSTVSITNTTISDNTAAVGGGINNADGRTVTAVNSIIAGNRSDLDDHPAPDFNGELTSSGHNLIGNNDRLTGTPGPGDQIGTNAAPIDPRLGPLQDNGGPTQTQALLPGSTAIDAGNDATAPARDQRGDVRAGVSDIGAFEFGGTLPVILANISTRVEVGHNNEGLFAGFIITGSQPKRLLLRALGASLPLSGALANTTLTLYNSTGQQIEFNDDWRTNSNAVEIEATGLAPAHDTESALLVSLAPGTYTALVSGLNGTIHGGVMFAPAIGLVEVYDLDRTVNAKLANISSRGNVRTGDQVMIAGVIVLGADSQRVIVRALGPSIDVPNHLLDPALDLHDGNGTLIASNDNWRTDQEMEIRATGLPPMNDAESALIRTLSPAPYTAIVRGVNGTAGIALVEVYALN
jgi:hypothetical protein